MNSKIALLIIALIILLGGGFLWANYGKTKSQKANITLSASTTPTQSTLPKAAELGATIMLTQSGFEPKKVTIKSGQRVIWQNKSGTAATVNSADHPTHKNYSPLNLGEFPDGGKVELDFSQPGTYLYHDHYHPEKTGVIVVE